MPWRGPGLKSKMDDGGDEGNVVGPRGFSRRRGPVRANLNADEFMALMHGSDPVRFELTRLENELRDKERELGEVHTEMRALRLLERAREKTVEEGNKRGSDCVILHCNCKVCLPMDRKATKHDKVQ